MPMIRAVVIAALLAGCTMPEVAGFAGGLGGSLVCGPACGIAAGKAASMAAMPGPPVTVTGDALAGEEARWPEKWPTVGVTRKVQAASSE